MDLQTNNSPISPFIAGHEPQNLWPFFRRQGNCTNPYQGVNIRWVEGSTNSPTNSNAPVNPAPQCANGQFPNNRSCRPTTTTGRLAWALPTRRSRAWSSARASASITTMTPPTPASTWPVTWPGVSRILRAVGLRVKLLSTGPMRWAHRWGWRRRQHSAALHLRQPVQSQNYVQPGLAV